MDKNSKKILKFLCKNNSNRYSIISLSKEFPEIPKDHLIEIVHFLYKENYVRYISDSSISITNKGITIVKVNGLIKKPNKVKFSNWISKNIVAILSLIVSIFAFIEATISLFLQSK